MIYNAGPASHKEQDPSIITGSCGLRGRGGFWWSARTKMSRCFRANGAIGLYFPMGKRCLYSNLTEGNHITGAKIMCGVWCLSNVFYNRGNYGSSDEALWTAVLTGAEVETPSFGYCLVIKKLCNLGWCCHSMRPSLCSFWLTQSRGQRIILSVPVLITVMC